jgi:hypothetical protein
MRKKIEKVIIIHHNKPKDLFFEGIHIHSILLKYIFITRYLFQMKSFCITFC